MANVTVVGLSMRAYARSRAERGLPGGTLRAVQKAAERGRVVKFANGLVDPVASDAAWESEMDPRAAMKRAAAGVATATVCGAAGMAGETVAALADVARAAVETVRPGGGMVRADGETAARVERRPVQGELAAAGGGGEGEAGAPRESATAELTRYRAELERLKTEDAREKRALRAGQLLDAAEVTAAQVTLAAEVRTWFMNFVNDASPDLAAALGVEERKVWIELNRVVKATLTKAVKKVEDGIAA